MEIVENYLEKKPNDAKNAFENAINAGFISEKQAGLLMYMFSSGGVNVFKNINSRKYETYIII